MRMGILAWTVLAAVVAVAVVAHAENMTNVTQLAWRDSGLDLAPGYVYTISVYSEYTRVPFGGFASEPGMEAGPLRIEVEADYHTLGGVTFRTRVYVNGELEWEGAEQGCGITCGSMQYNVAFRLECSCDGVCTLRYNGESIVSFSIDGPVDILYNDDEDGVFWHVSGRIRVTRSGGSGCYAPPPGNTNPQPPPQQYQPPVQPPTTTVNLPPGPDAMDRLSSSIAGAASAGIAVFTVGAAALALMIGYRQAKKHKLLAVPLLVLLLSSFFPVAHAELEPLSAFPVDEWRNGVVVIVCGGSYGTGEWISNEYILTANHVVDGHDSCEVLRGGASSIARIVATSAEYDIAVLRVEHPEIFQNKHIFPIRGTPPEVDEIAYVIGYPSELVRIYAGNMVRVSENPRVFRFHVPWYDVNHGLIEIGRTDQGNSGGPVVDAGQLIGVVSFALRTGVEYLFYATASNKIVEFLSQHNIPYTPGTSGPENIEEAAPGNRDTTLLHAAIAGAAASVVVNVLLIALAFAAGMHAAHAASRRRRRAAAR